MTGQTRAADRDHAPGLARLLELPRAERRAGLAELVEREFKRALLMSAEDELGPDDNYFDLGLTSLKASEVKQRLEAELGCELAAPVLFASASVGQVVDHLAGLVLPGGAAGAPAQARPAEDAARPAPGHRGLVDDLLRDLYGD
jgi:acyl carrier protein